MKALVTTALSLCLSLLIAGGCQRETPQKADPKAPAPIEEPSAAAAAPADTAPQAADEPKPSGRTKYAASSSFDFSDKPKIDSMLADIVK